MSKEIPLTQGKVAIVDAADFDWLNQWKWHYHPDKNDKGYAVRTPTINGHQIKISMHRLIISAPDGALVDHIDRNGLNNCRNNLRLASNSLNGHNTSSRPGTSRYKGVSFHKRVRRWHAQITTSGKTVSLGYFDTQSDAALAYNTAAIRVYGDQACINVVRPDPNEAAIPRKKRYSQYHGVSYRPEQSRWRAYVIIGSARKYLGGYATEDEAARAYDAFVKEHDLDRPLNFPD